MNYQTDPKTTDLKSVGSREEIWSHPRGTDHGSEDEGPAGQLATARGAFSLGTEDGIRDELVVERGVSQPLAQTRHPGPETGPRRWSTKTRPSGASDA